MSTSVGFAGKNRIEPGAYAETLGAQPNAPATAASGRVLVIDTGTGAGWGGGCGINGTRLNGVGARASFATVQDMQEFMVGGLWYDLATYLFAPDPKSGANGAQIVDYIAAKTSAPASIVLTFLNGGITIKTLVEGVIANAVKSSTNVLMNGFEAELVPGVQNTSAFILKFYKGTFTGLDEDGDPFDGIPATSTIPQFLFQSPEVTTIPQLVLWMQSDAGFASVFLYVSSFISGTGAFAPVDLVGSVTTALAVTVGTELMTPPTGILGQTPLALAQAIAAYVNVNSPDMTAAASNPSGIIGEVTFTGRVGTGATLNGKVPSFAKNGNAADITIASIVNMAGGVTLVETVNVAETRSFATIAYLSGTFVSSVTGFQINAGAFVINGAGQYIELCATNVQGSTATAVAAALAVQINLNIGGHGYTAVATTGTLVVTAPVGSGATDNGWHFFAAFNNAVTADVVTLVGGAGTGLFTFGGGVDTTYTIVTPEVLAVGSFNITALGYGGNFYSSGGTESFGSADLDAVLAAFADQQFNFILCDNYGDNAQGVTNTKILAFMLTDSAFGREAFIGGGQDALHRTQSNGSIPIAQYFNNKRVTVVHSGINMTEFNGQTQKTLSTLYSAAIVCGRIAGLEPQVPGTWKTIGISGLVDNMNLTDREFALQNGVLHMRFVDGIGFVINQSINSLQNNTQLVYQNGDTPEISLLRIADQLNTEIVLNARINFVGSNLNTTSPIDVKNFVEGYLKSRTAKPLADNLILSFSGINVVYVNGDYKISYSFQPNGPINKVFISSFMLNLSFTA